MSEFNAGQPLVGDIHMFPGWFVNETRLQPGDVLPQHRHHNAHISVLVFGSVLFLADGDAEPRLLHGPCILHVGAGKHHAVRALSGALWYCIHATDQLAAEVEVQAAALVDFAGDVDAEVMGQLVQRLQKGG